MNTEKSATVTEHITRRPVRLPDDETFLFDLYLSSRDDLDGVFSNEDQTRRLLEIQYRGQVSTYTAQYPDASHEIIELDGKPIGRLMVDRGREFVHCVDISLIPEARDRGIGTRLIKDLLDECLTKGVPCILQVLVPNKARRLYERLGFRVESDDGIRLLMKWRPSKGE